MHRTKRPQRTKGQGNLFKDPRSRYWQLSYWNGHRQVRQSARTEDRADALQILRERLSSVHVFSWGSSAEQVKTTGYSSCSSMTTGAGTSRTFTRPNSALQSTYGPSSAR